MITQLIVPERHSEPYHPAAFHDAYCPLCRSAIALQRRVDRAERLRWVAAVGEPGILARHAPPLEDAMADLHLLDSSGRWQRGGAMPSWSSGRSCRHSDGWQDCDSSRFTRSTGICLASFCSMALPPPVWQPPCASCAIFTTSNCAPFCNRPPKPCTATGTNMRARQQKQPLKLIDR